MKLSVTPDLASPRRLLVVGLAVGVVIALALAMAIDVRMYFGDPDDATRLVMVRDLLAGQGWYDPSVARIAPPHGLVMHWSRLLDGAIAALLWALRQVAPAGPAEWLTRVVWPLAWIPPAVLAALWLARNLGGRSAVMIGAVLLIVDPEIYRQFIPSRIDHHNVQIVMTLVAAACVTTDSRRLAWGVVGGVATAMGLAVGLEAVVFHALIGGVWAGRFATDRRDRRPVAAYGAALALASVGLFLLQTPPPRWSLSVCDALAANLVVALAVAGGGMVAVACVGARLSPPWRGMLLALVGMAAGAAYLALDPVCAHGPFAEVSPVARRVWLDTVEEVQPLAVMLRLDRTTAIHAIVVLVMSLAAITLLMLEPPRRPRPAVICAGVLLGVAALSSVFVWRVFDYVFWLGLPVIAAAGSRIAARRLGDVMVPTLAAAVLLSPNVVGAVANVAVGALQPQAAAADPDEGLRQCSAPAAFRQLRGLPPGLVLSEPDLGPYVLAYTRDAVIVAPYHRLSPEIIAAHDALDAAPAAAAEKVRSLRARYVVDCRGLALLARAGGLGQRLRAGATPPWLQRLSPPGATLAIYQVLGRVVR
jgi:hypothetical protein